MNCLCNCEKHEIRFVNAVSLIMSCSHNWVTYTSSHLLCWWWQLYNFKVHFNMSVTVVE